jgi:membrane protease YdiL (CAAX protease family)
MPKPTSKFKKTSPVADDLSYFGRSKQPLASLFFLVPLLIAYELGVMIFATDYTHGTAQQIYARSLLNWFFSWFGVTTHFLPGLLVVVLLLTLHLLSRARWRFEPRVYLVMAAESLVLAVPLFVLITIVGMSHSFARASGGASGGAPGSNWEAEIVFSIGAGIYEELLFRVIAIAIIHWLLVDWLEMEDIWGSMLTVFISAVLFAIYHFSSSNPFSFTKFLIYVLGGWYLAGVYVIRGFGIAAGTHAAYDLLVVAARMV